MLPKAFCDIVCRSGDIRKLSSIRRIQRERKSKMKKVICKVEYDTDASELIQKKVFGVFGDPKGYEESLYKTKDGKFFLYGFGGSESPYTEETITRIAANKVKAWQEA